MRALLRIYDFVIEALAFLAGASLALVFIAIVVSVLMRLVGLQEINGVVATTEYAMLYIGTLAAPWLLREKGHVSIEAVRQQLSARVRRLFAKTAYTIGLVVSIIVVVFSFPVLETNWGEYEFRAYVMHKQWLVLPVTVGFLLLGIGFARFLFGSESLYDDDSGQASEKVL